MSFRDSRIIRPVWPFVLNQSSPQAQGLVAWWPMIHAGGRTLFDLIAGRHLAAGGGEWLHTAYGPGWHTSGTQTADIASTPITAVPLTITAWAMPLDTAARVWGIVGQNIAWNGWYIEIEGGVWKAATAAGGVTFVKAAGTSSVVARTLYHIAAVYAADNNRKIYVNGRLEATETSSATPMGPNAIRIGNGHAGGTVFDGPTSEARLYNRALTDAEVFALFDPQTRYDLYWELGRQRIFTLDQTIAPNLLTQPVTIPQPAVQPGAVTVQPNLLTQSIAIPQPTISPGPVTVQPNTINQAVSVLNPTVLRLALAGATLTASDAAVTTLTASDELVED